MIKRTSKKSDLRRMKNKIDNIKNVQLRDKRMRFSNKKNEASAHLSMFSNLLYNIRYKTHFIFAVNNLNCNIKFFLTIY